jgi:hypothetical protein
MYSKGKPSSQGNKTAKANEDELEKPFSSKLYLITMEKMGMDETTAAIGKRYTDMDKSESEKP